MRWRRRSKRLMFVTGASGFLGRHLIEASERHEWELLAPSSDTLDIRDSQRVATEIGDWQPQVVVHLAYRRDDRACIVDGSRHVARAAAAAGARLIHLSTDVVFAGQPAGDTPQPYVEGDLPDPITDYGRYKAQAEDETMAAHPAAVMIRTSLMYGDRHLGVPQTDVLAVLRGESTMRFFTDEVRCPVHAGDVAEAICVLADRSDVIGPLHVAGPDALSRLDFAQRIATWLGASPPQVAALPGASVAGSGRPAGVVLDSGRAASLGIRCRTVADALRP